MASSDQPLVSIIIRARDEEKALKRLLPILAAQKTDFSFETWVLDNESHDGTAGVAQSFGACLHTIPRQGFNYATALNVGAQLAHGSILVHLSSHCFPQSESWLADLVNPLRSSQEVIATYGRQWIDPRQNPYEAEANDLFFPDSHDKLQMVTFSNANAAIRKSVVLQNPFNPEVRILEDHLFYLELSPYSLFEYVPEALVHHEHEHFSMRYYLKRWVMEGWSLYFILKQRGLASPFKASRFFHPQTLRGYARLSRKFYRTGYKWAGLAGIPFFLLREILWTWGWLQGRMARLQTARRDRDFLYDLIVRSRQAGDPQQSLIENHLDSDMRSWPEEWQLKANWPYLRQNITDFIQRCYESDTVFQSPLLEIGASGQNDFLGDKYEMITSNLAYNRQETEMALDMEDMHIFEANSIGSILCSEVIEHVKHPDLALAEAFRVLKPGGKLILTTPYAIVVHNTPEDGGFHGRNFTPQGLELCVQEAGFKIHTLETTGTTLTRRRLLPSNIFIIAEKPA